MPETKMLDKRNMNDHDPNKMKDEMTEMEHGMAEKKADLTDEMKGGIQGNEGSTCSGRDPHVPKTPVKKETQK